MNLTAEKVTITFAYIEFLGEEYQVYGDGSVEIYNDHCEAFITCPHDDPHINTVREAGLACLFE